MKKKVRIVRNFMIYAGALLLPLLLVVPSLLKSLLSGWLLGSLAFSSVMGILMICLTTRSLSKAPTRVSLILTGIVAVSLVLALVLPKLTLPAIAWVTYYVVIICYIVASFLYNLLKGKKKE